MLRKEIQSLEDINKRIKRARKIKLSKLDAIPEGMDLKQFVLKFVTDYNLKQSTIYITSKRQQCRVGALRSAGDITKIAQHYFGEEEATIGKVRRILHDLVRDRKIGVSVCYSIYKRVYTPNAQNNYNTTRDEFGRTFNEQINED